MITLYYAYSYNMITAVEDGSLNFKNSNNQTNEFPAYEKLALTDIEIFAKFAYEKNDFRMAIEILESLFQLIRKSKTKINETLIKNIQKLKKNLIQLNNEYLQKRKKIIGKQNFFLKN